MVEEIKIFYRLKWFGATCPWMDGVWWWVNGTFLVYLGIFSGFETTIQEKYDNWKF